MPYRSGPWASLPANLIVMSGHTSGAIINSCVFTPLRLAHSYCRLPLLLLEDVKNQLNAARDSKFLVNPKQIIAHRVLGETQPRGRIAVRQAFGDQLHDIVFTPR